MSIQKKLAGDVWRCVVAHTKKNHKLRLTVTDFGQSLDCVFCGMPAVMGSADVVEQVCSMMQDSGIEFEVHCETVITH